MTTVQLELSEPFAFITMDRAAVRNTMNQQMINELTQAFMSLLFANSVPYGQMA